MAQSGRRTEHEVIWFFDKHFGDEGDKFLAEEETVTRVVIASQSEAVELDR